MSALRVHHGSRRQPVAAMTVLLVVESSLGSTMAVKPSRLRCAAPRAEALPIAGVFELMSVRVLRPEIAAITLADSTFVAVPRRGRGDHGGPDPDTCMTAIAQLSHACRQACERGPKPLLTRTCGGDPGGTGRAPDRALT